MICCRVALITYSGQAYVHFKFNDFKFGNNTSVIRYLNTLRSIKGTTSTHLALHEAYELFTNRDGTSGARDGIPKLAVVLTDGHSQRSPRNLAKRLRAEGVVIFAVSMTPSPYVDEGELLNISQDPSKVFTPANIQEFESELLRYVGFGCPGMELGPDAVPRVRGATDVTCGPNSITFTVRTQKPMTGLMYAQQYYDDEKCVKVTDGSSREVSITFVEGTCGLSKMPSVRRDGYSYNITVILQFHPLIITRADQRRDGYSYNITVILQFHPLIITRADQGLSVSCFHQQPISMQEIGRSTLKKLTDTECSYRLHRFGPDYCVALDAKVGESLYHKWECDSPANYHYLVHDCYVRSETKNFKIIDSEGCEIDPHFLETPDYSRFYEKPRKGDAYVFKEMSVFKFPSDYNVVFECKISLCDMESGAPCTQMIPPKCSGVLSERPRRATPETKDGFSLTVHVETRTLNVLENESIRPAVPVKYCDIRM
uniref:ZP domain-containing protein n=1 Tax=Ascaris lumbricoides TaxID=6252 RepID=A0A0M3IEN4_ASCLU